LSKLCATGFSAHNLTHKQTSQMLPYNLLLGHQKALTISNKASPQPGFQRHRVLPLCFPGCREWYKTAEAMILCQYFLTFSRQAMVEQHCKEWHYFDVRASVCALCALAHLLLFCTSDGAELQFCVFTRTYSIVRKMFILTLSC